MKPLTREYVEVNCKCGCSYPLDEGKCPSCQSKDISFAEIDLRDVISAKEWYKNKIEELCQNIGSKKCEEVCLFCGKSGECLKDRLIDEAFDIE